MNPLNTGTKLHTAATASGRLLSELLLEGAAGTRGVLTCWLGVAPCCCCPTVVAAAAAAVSEGAPAPAAAAAAAAGAASTPAVKSACVCGIARWGISKHLWRQSAAGAAHSPLMVGEGLALDLRMHSDASSAAVASRPGEGCRCCCCWWWAAPRGAAAGGGVSSSVTSTGYMQLQWLWGYRWHT